MAPTYFDLASTSVDRPASIINADSFWRKDAPEMDGTKVVRGGMWTPQKQWWDLDTFIKVLVGGYGTGKTNILSKRMIALALENAPCPVAIVSPTYKVARRTTIETVAHMLAGKRSIYGRQFWWRWAESYHEFKIRFKGREARIWIYSGEDPDSLKGPNLAAAGIDEPFIQSEKVFEQMMARIRHPDAKIRELGLTGTPEQLNWGYDLCDGELSERHDVSYIQASSRSNKALPTAYIAQLEATFTDKAAAAMIEGAFVNLASGLVYYGFDPRENVVELGTPRAAELGVGMDFNVNPMSASLFWRAGSHMHFFDEIELPNADTEYMASTLRDRFGDRLTEVYPDATGSARKTAAPGGKTDHWYLRQAGFTINAPAQNPKRKDRYNAVNGKLKPKQGKLTLTISPKCKKTIKYLQTYSHELMNNQQSMSHLLDAFSYPISYLFPVTRDGIITRLRGA